MDEMEMLSRIKELKKSSDFMLIEEFKFVCKRWQRWFRLLKENPDDMEVRCLFIEADANVFLIREELKRRYLP